MVRIVVPLQMKHFVTRTCFQQWRSTICGMSLSIAKSVTSKQWARRHMTRHTTKDNSHNVVSPAIVAVCVLKLTAEPHCCRLQPPSTSSIIMQTIIKGSQSWSEIEEVYKPVSVSENSFDINFKCRCFDQWYSWFHATPSNKYHTASRTCGLKITSVWYYAWIYSRWRGKWEIYNWNRSDFTDRPGATVS